MPGYRLRLPVKVHPVSAGVKGGLVGGLVMPLPALAYGILSGHGIWWPVNLLAGMVLPGVDNMSSPSWTVSSCTVGDGHLHSRRSCRCPGLDVWRVDADAAQLSASRSPGAHCLMPLLWTAVSYVALGAMNPGVREGHRVALVCGVAICFRRGGSDRVHAV